MLKRNISKIFDTNKLDEFALGVQDGSLKTKDIPLHYQYATRMVLRHGRDWWKYI